MPCDPGLRILVDGLERVEEEIFSSFAILEDAAIGSFRPGSVTSRWSRRGKSLDSTIAVCQYCSDGELREV